MKFLAAPWRWTFIKSISAAKGCLFCRAPAENDDESLICYRGDRFYVILNKYPYSGGHLMIVPFEHLKSPGQLSPEAAAEMWTIASRSLEILEKEFHPHGFNIGMNVGKAAGAGVKDHIHLHIVPRWPGDANFMATIGETRVVSYSPETIRDTLRRAYAR